MPHLLFAPLNNASRKQSNSPTRPSCSDLSLQNLSQCSRNELRKYSAVSDAKDSGLMVELKRWVAKDATDHGQIPGESDLSDYA